VENPRQLPEVYCFISFARENRQKRIGEREREKEKCTYYYSRINLVEV